jgi:hypothetical protein
MKVLPLVAGIAFVAVVLVTGQSWLIALPMFGVGGIAAGAAWLLAQ